MSVRKVDLSETNEIYVNLLEPLVVVLSARGTVATTVEGPSP